MSISGFSNAFVSTMLGWLKGLANWVLRLFNLAGASGTSPLLWLSNNWGKLLAVFLVLGIALDVIVWLVRWRPYWVWFRKERVIVNDETFFAGGRMDHRNFTEDDELADEDWQERDFLVTSSVAKKRERRAAPSRASEPERPTRRRSSQTRVPERRPRAAHARRGARGTIVKRGEGAGGRSWDDVVVHRGAGDGGAAEEDLFGVNGAQAGVTDSYEDEVFNVNSLPPAGDGSTKSLFGGGE